jgi:protein-disulfide isomerase
MLFAKRFAVVLIVGALGAVPVAHAADALASDTATVTIPATAFDTAIRDFLKRNPEAVTEALMAAQAKQQAKKMEAAQAAVTTKDAEIYKADSPVAGNPNGKETLVEFFDYSCHYCKQIHPDIQTLIKDDPNLKVIYKDFPILGPGSLLAAKAALAARHQGKYLEIHDALLNYKGTLDDTAIQSVAKDVGLDYTKLKADMDKPDIMAQIQANVSLADALNIHGTPSMLINRQLVDGALPLDQMKQKLKDTSKG